mmetsp:Transcript_34001/g.73609  ORF Transcript_34001/g.73609 Transcript_34001/m.73609 type:complete len:259 (-) Transcript_34001:58-834(-)
MRRSVSPRLPATEDGTFLKVEPFHGATVTTERMRLECDEASSAAAAMTAPPPMLWPTRAMSLGRTSSRAARKSASSSTCCTIFFPSLCARKFPIESKMENGFQMLGVLHSSCSWFAITMYPCDARRSSQSSYKLAGPHSPCAKTTAGKVAFSPSDCWGTKRSALWGLVTLDLSTPYWPLPLAGDEGSIAPDSSSARGLLSPGRGLPRASDRKSEQQHMMTRAAAVVFVAFFAVLFASGVIVAFVLSAWLGRRRGDTEF